MVFTPSKRLREIANQPRIDDKEYKRLYKIEFRDPSSWQPLDNSHTFDHYARMHGFGLSVAQQLRITEGTNHYRLRNRRFQEFEQEQENWLKCLEDVNTETECFGYAQCIHRQDGCSTEWRRALVNRPKQQGDDGVRYFPASFIHTPL